MRHLNIITLSLLLIISHVANAQAPAPSDDAPPDSSISQLPPPAAITPAATPSKPVLDPVAAQILAQIQGNINTHAGVTAQQLTILEIFLAVVLPLAGLLLVLIQYRFDRRMEQNWSEWKKAQEESNALQIQLRDSILEPKIDEVLERLLEAKYFRLLEARVEGHIPKALGNSTAERGLLLARLRRFRNEVGDCLEPIDPKAAACFRENSAAAIQNWHSLGMLFSTRPDDVLKGLQDFAGMPFVEATGQLKSLRVEYRGNPEVQAALADANEALKQQQLREMPSAGNAS